MHIIGLCGQSGSGKSTVADCFSSFGVPVLDADKIYRELTDAPSACLDAIQQAFGEQAVTDCGALNRVFLREVVFASEDASEKRALLNQITHTFVKGEFERRIALLKESGIEAVLLDVPLLFESGIDKLCDFLICVTADEKIRIARIMARDKISQEQALSRIRSQIDEQTLIDKTHFHIRNDEDRASLENQIQQIYKTIFKGR